jgi:tetratricopeptide (TPR) repeat protein
MVQGHRDISIMNGQSIRERFKSALRYEKEGNFAMALQEYTSIVQEDRAHKETYINLGSLYSRMNRLGDAMKCYEKALSLGEDYLVHFNVGSIYYKMGHYKRAVLQLEKSRKLNGSFALTLLVMGLSFSRLRNYKAAEKCFQEVLRLLPDNRTALTAVAIICFETGRYEEALGLIDKILGLDSANTGIRKLRADVLFRMNRPEESAGELKTLKESREEFKSYDEFVRSIPAEMYADKYGTIDEKIETLKTRSRFGGDKEDLLSLSLCFLLKGDSDKAIDYLIEARKSILN